MAESDIAIEYEPMDPIAKRRPPVALPFAMGALLLGGIGGWMLHSVVDERRPEFVIIGHASEFPPGSVTELALDVGHFDPFGPESPDADLSAGQKSQTTRIFVVSDSAGQLVALSQKSPWLGCRVTLVNRPEAIEYGHEPPATLDRGFLDPCHSGLWSLDGHRIDGGGVRGLTSFPIRYLPDGSVVVDLTAAKEATT